MHQVVRLLTLKYEVTNGNTNGYTDKETKT
ncbi:hypothetical protein KX01_979 [Francisella frigiditurris]|uniref:Uncharacterized protein n=1 Tax=Francisella frigiditurris TaxID=1542390 RepID=A0A1J0KT91_9GAMM|nr:hypothetical protein KX01_979 [Francisella frigiditurris]